MEVSNTSQEYILAVKDIKRAILKSRYIVAKNANKDLLQLYYSVGGYVSSHSRDGYWGSNSIDTISQLLQQELPGLRGFSTTNIKNMRIFYEQWSPYLNRQLTTDEFPIESFMSVGFTNHMLIIYQVKDVKERLFYIDNCAKGFWTIDILKYHIKEGFYHKAGSIKQTNFNKTISDNDFKRRALQSFKDEYLLDFINIEDPEDADERVIEQGIIQNIKNFIMAFGKDFAFLGNQYHLEVEGHDYYIDLLFFSRKLRSLVAFELKRGEFKPEYTGKLNFYLSALDEYAKLPDENPSIGIILCKSKNDKIVELSFRDASKPMGVATYRTSSELPKELRDALPDIEDLKNLL